MARIVGKSDFRKKFHAIEPDEREISALRRKLSELVTRLQKDYQRLIKPIVLQMSVKKRMEIKKESNELKQMEGMMKQQVNKSDSVEYLTVAEVANQVKMLKYEGKVVM